MTEATTTKASWFIYLIRTRQGCLYTGITTDVSQRLAEHEGSKKGAKYLRAKGPLRVVYEREIGGRSLTSKIEYRIKKLSKARKEKLVNEQLNKQALLALLKVECSEQCN